MFPTPWRMVLAAVCTLAPLLASALCAAPVAAERPGRLVETLHGITIEFSPGHEAYVAPLAEGLAKWREELAAQRTAALAHPLPLSATDLHQNRAEILREIAAAIGLDEPTALQVAGYDTFLNYYLAFSELNGLRQRLGLELAAAPQLALWRREELVERLQRGECIDGFSYDTAKDEIEFSFGFTTPGRKDGENAAQAMEAARLDHAFNYEVKDGIAHLSGRFSLRPGEKRVAGIDFDPVRFRQKTDHEFRQLKLIMPVVLEEEGALLSPDEVVASELATRRQYAAGAQQAPYRDGGLAMIVLHETTEIGLLDRYIGSADRRWWCDGTANYVAWNLARQRAGEEFAREVYDLSAQLAQHAARQDRIRLNRWLAVEHEHERERDEELNQAHYAFATRAVLRIAERHGDEMIAKLWREVGRTPRDQVSMQTVARAYRKLTGERLSRIIRYAEKTPVAAATAPVAVRARPEGP